MSETVGPKSASPPAAEPAEPPTPAVPPTADSTPDSLLRTVDWTRTPTTLPPVHRDPALPQVDGYELLALLGRGGMGVVYQARHQGLDRLVALKMIRGGASAGPEDLQRFRTEAEAIARLQHPNIVQIFEVGQSGDLPFFALEYCAGGSLARQLAGTPQAPGVAAQLVEKLARAIHYAHERGIVHRDLKPANVLLQESGVRSQESGIRDQESETRSLIPDPRFLTPKITDFGLAKKLDSAGQTHTGQVVGTPSYMAPEQAGGESKTLGPACDIYALGAILYECLTGRPPFKAATAVDTVLQVLQQEPVPPAQLNPRVPRDLETICLKCLRKEPGKRYATALELAEDLRRFQLGEPIAARPVGRLERLTKWARRRPAVAALSGSLLLATLLLIAALATGIIVSTDALGQAHQALQAAETQRRLAEQAATAEGEAKIAALDAARAERLAKEKAARRLQQIEKAYELLSSVFRDLDPDLEKKGAPPLLAQLGERLNKAAELLQGEAIGDPVAVARLQLTLGLAQVHLGYPKRALVLFTEARQVLEAELGPDDPETFSSINHLGLAYHSNGQSDMALPLWELALEKRKGRLGSGHIDTLISMNNLATVYQATGQSHRALPLLEQVLDKKRAKFGADNLETLLSMNNLAAVYQATGRSDKALPLFEQVLYKKKTTLGPDHLSTLQSMNGLGEAYWAAGKSRDALPLFEQAVVGSKASVGLAHPVTLRSMHNLASAYRTAGQLDKALPLFEQTMEKQQATLGPDHPSTLGSMNGLALVYQATGQLDKALSLYEHTLERRQATLGPDHRDTLISMNNLAGGLYQAKGQYAKALSLHEQVYYKRQATLSPDHTDLLVTMNNLAAAYQDTRQLDKAVPLYEQTLKLLTAKVGPDHPDTLAITNNLAEAYRETGQFAQALPLHQQTLEKKQARLGPDHPETLKSMSNLGLTYWASGQAVKAVPLHEQALEKRKAKLGPDHPDTLVSMNNLALAYRDTGQYDKAVPLHKQTLQMQEARLGPGHPSTMLSVNNLAVTHYRFHRYAEAESLFALWIDRRRPKLPADDSQLALQLNLLGECQAMQKKHKEAEKPLRESLGIYQKRQPQGVMRYDTESLLGAVLLGQQKYAEAEPLLLSSANALKAGAAKLSPPDRTLMLAAVQRVIDLYDAWKRADDAARWRKELETLKTPGERPKK